MDTLTSALETIQKTSSEILLHLETHTLHESDVRKFVACLNETGIAELLNSMLQDTKQTPVRRLLIMLNILDDFC